MIFYRNLEDFNVFIYFYVGWGFILFINIYLEKCFYEYVLIYLIIIMIY